MLKKNLKKIWYSIGRIICLTLCKIFFSLKVIGHQNIPAEGGFLLVSNHQSFLDPVLCGCGIKRQLHFLARDTLFKKRFFRWLCFSLNAIPLRLDKADISAMKTIIEKLQKGEAVVLYPEATRTSDGRIAPFKSGLAILCRRGNAAIVPMLIDGAFESWPRNKKMFTIGKKIVVRYGQAVTAEQAKSMDDEKLADYLTSTIRSLQSQVRIEEGKEPFSY